MIPGPPFQGTGCHGDGEQEQHGGGWRGSAPSHSGSHPAGVGGAEGAGGWQGYLPAPVSPAQGGCGGHCALHLHPWYWRALGGLRSWLGSSLLAELYSPPASLLGGREARELPGGLCSQPGSPVLKGTGGLLGLSVPHLGSWCQRGRALRPDPWHPGAQDTLPEGPGFPARRGCRTQHQ